MKAEPIATYEEIARRVLDAFTADDLAGDMRSGALAEVLEEVAAPDFSCSFLAGSAGEIRNDFAGVEGFLDGWADWADAFESYRIELDGEPIAMGDALLANTIQVATVRGAATAIETRAAGVFFMRAGKLARIELHLDRDEARRAAGLERAPSADQ